MTIQDFAAWKEVAGILGAAGMAMYLTWKAGRRKTILSTPYTEELNDQPRVVTRGEWHTIANLVNAVPGHGESLRRIDKRMADLEEKLDEHLKTSADAMTSFARLETEFHGFKREWDAVGVNAREDRQQLRSEVQGLSARIDNVLRLARG